MTRFVTYDPEVASRLAQAVGVHRVELREPTDFPRKANPAILDLIRSPQRNALLMPSSDEQVLVVHVDRHDSPPPAAKQRKKNTKQPSENEFREIGTQPSGFLGLQDEAVFSDEPEDPPRSLWKQEE